MLRQPELRTASHFQARAWGGVASSHLLGQRERVLTNQILAPAEERLRGPDVVMSALWSSPAVGRRPRAAEGDAAEGDARNRQRTTGICNHAAAALGTELMTI